MSSMSAHNTQKPASTSNNWGDALWAVLAAFGCYFCMYAFRKPFTAAAFADSNVGDMSFKTMLVTAQVSGYMLSKFIGIKVIAEMPSHRRAWTLMGLILIAQIALILFGLLPRPWNVVCLFLNGLPLGMVFGLVLSFLEGRRLTEALTAGLCASFILADGATKSVGRWLLSQGITEDWMPCVAGALFLAPQTLFVAMLSRISPPNDQDIAARSARATMTRAERWELIARHGTGVLPLVLMYLSVTIVRSLRADFAPELWRELGTAATPSAFARTELWVAAGVLVVNGTSALICDNRRAFLGSLGICAAGFALLTVALIGQGRGGLSAEAFMVLIGLGLYLPYVAIHTTVFERLLAMIRERGNIGFLMYVADSIGYLGYVCVMLARNATSQANNMLPLLVWVSWLTVGLSAFCLVVAAWYFARDPSRSVTASHRALSLNEQRTS